MRYYWEFHDAPPSGVHPQVGSSGLCIECTTVPLVACLVHLLTV